MNAIIFSVFLYLLVALFPACSSWSPKPDVVDMSANVRTTCVSERRQFVQSFAVQCSTVLPPLLLMEKAALASNLPVSNGADTSKVGTAEALIPVVSMRYSLSRLETQLQNQEKDIQVEKVAIPRNEKDFKRIFDAYSEKISYKQKFLDQNAFLVYYTKGFDGPGRANIEEDINQRQTLQFGARNEAWIAWEEFLVELEYIDEDDNDLSKYLAATIRAIDSYLLLAPESDVQQAKQTLGLFS